MMRLGKLILVILLLATPVHAATIYMGAGETYTDLQAAMATANAGDTIIIRDGTYTGASNMVDDAHKPPDGSAGNYTIIKAETDGGAIFDGESTRNMFALGAATSYTDHYWQFEGIHWKNCSAHEMALYGASYVKFLRCGFSEDSNELSPNAYVRFSRYVLLEDCYAYGGGRYKFIFAFAQGAGRVPTQYNIMRRCVARLDNVSSTEPVAGFANYSSHDNEFQNCIIIDSDESDDWYAAQSYAGSFGVITTEGASTNIYFRGCIALNSDLGGICTAKNSYATNIQFLDCIIWESNSLDLRPNWIRGNAVGGDTDSRYIQRCTFGESTGVGTPGIYQDDNDYAEIKNCIITKFTMANALGASGSSWTQDYNSYYANTSNNNAGAHDITNVDPLAASLLYLPRIETGSALKGAGENGSDIGANVMKKIGVSGTLYGETGYDTTTDDDLWPFPNEDLIKTKFASYSYDSGGVVISGARGFAHAANKQLNGTDDVTLTSYIWEYLGNQIPSDIYGSPSTPSIRNGGFHNGGIR